MPGKHRKFEDMDFFEQTFEVVEQCGFELLNWLDLGCGTGMLEEKALNRF